MDVHCVYTAMTCIKNEQQIIEHKKVTYANGDLGLDIT